MDGQVLAEESAQATAQFCNLLLKMNHTPREVFLCSSFAAIRILLLRDKSVVKHKFWGFGVLMEQLTGWIKLGASSDIAMGKEWYSSVLKTWC